MMAMRLVAGIDLGGTAINYTFLDEAGHFRIDGLCEHPARSVDGPDVCLAQIADGFVCTDPSAVSKLFDTQAARRYHKDGLGFSMVIKDRRGQFSQCVGHY